jgi:ABC-type dipeptide/oligopeptide/nickel transport system permease component
MKNYLLKRVLLSFPVALGVLVLVFALMHLIPGDPVEVMLGESASQADRSRIRAELHLDDSLPEQFYYFVRDLGTGRLKSIYYNQPVFEQIGKRLKATAVLALAAMMVSLFTAVPMGIWAAVRKGKAADNLAMGFSMLGVSMPSFWLGPMLILVFSIKLGWLPVSGRGGLAHLVLPALTLGLGMAAIVSRMMRGSLLDVMGEEYLRVARAKGLSERAVILRHALRNAMIPTISVVGLQAGALFSGAIITETIFAWPGVGSLLIQAVHARDFPMVQAVVIVIAMSYVLINLLTDLIYGLADPRVRYEGGES